jgi:hypothetical protein
LRIKVFCWLVIRNWILTKENLLKKRVEEIRTMRVLRWM